MINLLRGEFYKLFKSRSFYICALVGAGIVILMCGMLFFADAIQKGEVKNGTVGIYVDSSAVNEGEASAPLLKEITILDMVRQVFGNFGYLVAAIFVSIFVIMEYGNGAIKNVVGKGYGRWQIFAAKYISSVIGGVILLIFMILLTLIGGVIIQSLTGEVQELNSRFLRELFVYSGIQLILGTALIGLIVSVSEICRNLAAGISISVGITGVSTLISGALDLMIKVILPQSQFKATDYWLIDLTANCPVRGIDTKFAFHAVIVAIGWIIISAGSGVVHFRKADIK